MRKFDEKQLRPGKNEGSEERRWRDNIQKIAGKNRKQTALDRERWKNFEAAYIKEWMIAG